MSSGKILILRALLSLVHHIKRAPRVTAWITSLMVAAPLAGSSCLGGDLRVATYNLRHFGVEPKDMNRLVRIFERLDADVVAVQEIRRTDRLEQLARELSGSRRSYRAVSSLCAGHREMHVGFLYDAKKVTLKETREFRELLPEEGSCSEGDRPGFLGIFQVGGDQLHALVVHLKSGGSEEDFRQRRQQIERLNRLTGLLRAQGAQRLVVLGDMNTTGYLDNTQGERDLLGTVARNHGLVVATDGLRCTEYYRKNHHDAHPSLLDHALVSRAALVPFSTEVHEHCAKLRCAPQPVDSMPPSYTDISDHCPVTFRMTR
ncbi:MAG: endonuclease/exonuclease/phosphatase family protein [Myxococcales bacterium]|nr:endonuclease/exonuclease/phosphatase family protein [Polyangiaceae bacterium]MDW8248363.1 endonuclease/exonuclease/phosphatase family protein [Myxococcales bacterium]